MNNNMMLKELKREMRYFLGIEIDEKYWKYEQVKEYEEFRNELEKYFNNKLNAYMIQSINNQVKVFLKQVKYETEYTRVKTEIDEVVDEILDLLIA